MEGSKIPRVFVPAEVINTPIEGLEPASADSTFYLVGPPGRYEDPGFLVRVDHLHDVGVPIQVAEQVALMASLRNSEHMMLLRHNEKLWEMLVHSGKSLPDTYTFKL